ncbi:MAG: FAD-dependent oxidoreductase [Thermoactinospora sp.]|nr:FAD-dependent oxidoreductase [Thermoactinospora sp.]
MDPLKALADAERKPYWLDEDPAEPEPLPRLFGRTTADLAIVGGGFSGLWTALLAKERDPKRDVVLLEAQTVGWAASGRNGGFCHASLTHGLENGLERWPQEIATLYRLGIENLDEIEETIRRYDIDCSWERTGEMNVATEPWQLDGMEEAYTIGRELGMDIQFLDASQARAEVNSPTYLGGLWERGDCAMLDPARLAWGLRQACLSLGVRIYEHSRVLGMDRDGTSMELTTQYGTLHAARVVLGTGVFSPLLKRLKYYLVPVYDYALMTEPLSAAQRESIGWHNRQGMGDNAYQFHYYRITDDNSILWGGYDAIYYSGGKIKSSYDQRDTTFLKLAEQFYDTFPQLEDVKFSHRWGGVIDTCSRYSAFYGTAYGSRVAYAVGYTGLGVAATRFGANVMLDLLDGRESERTRLQMVKEKPIPFPPEPLRSAAIQLTRWSIAQADRKEGKRNLWLRTLDRVGLGFDS